MYEQIATENTQRGEDNNEQRRNRLRKRMPDEGSVNKSDLSSRKIFETQNYLVIIDSLLADLEKWMKAYNDTCKTFGFISDLKSLSFEQVYRTKLGISLPRIHVTWKTH